jgi:alginate O-acetyltransferase complex protein AlgI
MVFSSSIFLFFFLPLVIIGYYLLKENYRVYFLMLASLFFYAWGEPKYILIMLLSIIINYTFGLFIHLSISSQRKLIAKILLILSVACNLGILFYFKYLDFSINTVNRVFHSAIALRDIVLPIGISFFTFQGMSYVIDLYRQKVSVQKNPGLLAFYISFFPQLIAGPIVRYIDIEKQIYSRTESIEKFMSGAQRFIIGLAKKLVIANNMGYVADLVFNNPALENTAAIAWLGVICYTFQIYFDFSGYSDMAIGLGKMFGFEFLENFNYPYISKTITEFWRRWHMSLSSWFKDYVYIPLGGNRKGNVYVNLLIVFIVTGFWHGASFNFLAWGLWHGLFLIIERLFSAREIKSKKFVPLRYVISMLIVVVGWVFFRSPGLRYALSYLGIMFGFLQPENVGFTIWYYFNLGTILMMCLAILASTPAMKHLFGFIKLRCSARTEYAVSLKLVTSIITLALFFVCIVIVTSTSYNPFIYFRF